MAKSITYPGIQETATSISHGLYNLAQFSVKKNTGDEVILESQVSPLNAPVSIQVRTQGVTNVYTNTGVPVPNQYFVRSGARVTISVIANGVATDSDAAENRSATIADEEIIIPTKSTMSFTFLKSGYISGTDLNKACNMLLSVPFDTTGASHWDNLLRGNVNPKEY